MEWLIGTAEAALGFFLCFCFKFKCCCRGCRYALLCGFQRLGVKLKAGKFAYGLTIECDTCCDFVVGRFKPLQYTVIYIIMDALLVGAWEIIALAVSVATRNPLQPALFPFLLYLLLYFICNWLQMDSVSLFAILLPFQPAVNVKWVTIAIYFLAVPIGSMTMYFLKRNKSDVL